MTAKEQGTINRVQRTLARFRSRASFNLVELSLAVAVVAIGIVSVFGILPHLLRSSRQAVEYDAITLDIQNFVDDPAHRGQVTLYDLTRVTPSSDAFPDVSNPYREPIFRPGFEGQLTYATIIATNADVAELPYKAYTNQEGSPLLRTIYMSYTWGNTNNPTNMQRFTFVTEVASTISNKLY
jgi:E3 ubiquitin-protein ligase DOA10